jgi:hypothetical protein
MVRYWSHAAGDLARVRRRPRSRWGPPELMGVLAPSQVGLVAVCSAVAAVAWTAVGLPSLSTGVIATLPVLHTRRTGYMPFGVGSSARSGSQGAATSDGASSQHAFCLQLWARKPHLFLSRVIHNIKLTIGNNCERLLCCIEPEPKLSKALS